MTSIPNERVPTCPACGTALGLAPGGLCPKCLMQAAGPTAEASTPSDVARPEALRGLFPEYEIFELLGRGGMGAVYRAQHKRLARHVALKVLLPDLSEDPEFAARFTREAQAMARLDHPNVVGVHDFGEREGIFYLVMEFVDGSNLRELIDQGALTSQDVLKIVPQICDALQFAHQRHVVHRDVKPENILIDEELRVRIADFGLAKLMGGGDQFVLTRTEQVFGTPQYMAPEQMKTSAEVDHRADIYSLGVVLYEMLTGELPIGRFDAPSAKGHASESMDEVVLKSLASEPSQRYQTADAVKAGVEGSAQAAPVPVAPSPASPSQKPTTDEPAPAADHDVGVVLATIAILIASFMAWASWRNFVVGSQASLTIRRSAWGCELFGIPCWLVVCAGVVFAGLYFARRSRVAVSSASLIVLAAFGGLFSVVWMVLGLVMNQSLSAGAVLSAAAFGYLLHIEGTWATVGHALRRLRDRSGRSKAGSAEAGAMPLFLLWAAIGGFVILLVAMLLPWDSSIGNAHWLRRTAFETRNGLILVFAILYVGETCTAILGIRERPRAGLALAMAAIGFLYSWVAIIQDFTPGPTISAVVFGVWILCSLRYRRTALTRPVAPTQQTG